MSSPAMTAVTIKADEKVDFIVTLNRLAPTSLVGFNDTPQIIAFGGMTQDLAASTPGAVVYKGTVTALQAGGGIIRVSVVNEEGAVVLDFPGEIQVAPVPLDGTAAFGTPVKK